MAEYFMFRCVKCGVEIPVRLNPNPPETIVCPSCGQVYQKSNPGILDVDPPDFWAFFAGAILGFIAGGIVFTELGRSLAISLIKRGAGVTEEKIREWIERGERR